MKLNQTYKRILLFAVLAIVLNEGVKLYFSKVGIQNHMLVKQERKFNKYTGDLDYLFLGHSRVARAIDTSQIAGSYVYYSGAESNVNTYYKLKFLLENHADRITTVILPIGITSVQLTKTDKLTNSFYWSKYIDYSELGELTGDRSTYWKLKIKTMLFPYYEYPYIRLMQNFGELRIEFNDSTYHKANKEVKLEMVGSILSHHNEFTSVYDTTAIEYINKTITLANSHNKKLVFIKYPVSAEYLESVKLTYPNWLKKQRTIDESLKTNTKVLFLDFEKLFEDNPKYFKDSHHLNEDGRKEFTYRLIKTLQQNNH